MNKDFSVRNVWESKNQYRKSKSKLARTWIEGHRKIFGRKGLDTTKKIIVVYVNTNK